MDNTVSRYLVRYPLYHVLNGKFLAHYRELERTQWLSREELERLQLRKLRDLLKYVCRSVPFYRKELQRRGIETSDIRRLDDIRSVPVLSRDDVRANFPELQSTDGFSLKVKRETSGTSGSPLTVLKERRQLGHMDAVAFRNYGWFGIGIGDRQLKFWGGSISRSSQAKTYLKDKLLNNYRFSPYELNEKLYETVIRRMNHIRPDYIYGYSTAIFQFSNYLHEKGIRPNIDRLKAVICTAETLFDYQKQLVAEVFPVPVAREYGCTELGVIAMECQYGNMHIMSDSLIVETCNHDENDSGDILVTDLHSRLFPLIRFRIGDRGRIENIACRCGRELPFFAAFHGRCEEYIKCPDGTLVDPYIFEHILKAVPEGHKSIEQFRIIQKAIDKVLVQLVVRQNPNSRILQLIKEKFAVKLHSQVEVEIECVNCLARDRSGKLRCFISELEHT